VELRRSDPANVGIVFQMQQAGQGFDLGRERTERKNRDNGEEFTTEDTEGTEIRRCGMGITVDR
jgi:hypothetical protein